VKTEAQLVRDIAAAPTLREQAVLVAELDALKRAQAHRVQAASDWDAASTVVEQTLTPVLTHSFHTASTDWLADGSLEASEPARERILNQMHAEAATWFSKTSAMVKADREEFDEQARGLARRLASAFGGMAPEAAQAFLDYAAFLLRREAASGLDQVQQLVDPRENPKRTPLPEETFDTFYDPIDPMNQGVDEMQTSDNAPLLQEILQEGAGSGAPEWNQGHSTAGEASQPPYGGSGLVTAQGSLVEPPSPAVGYLYNMAEFVASQNALQSQASREPSDDQEDHSTSGSPRVEKVAEFQVQAWEDSEKCRGCGKPMHWMENSLTDEDTGLCADCIKKEMGIADKYPSPGEHAKTGASGLPQVQQVVDSFENPAPQPLPEEVAFPLIPYFQNGHADAGYEQRKAAGLRTQADTFTPPAQNVGSENPILDETHDGSAKKVDKPKNAMEKATASLSKQAAADFNKGARFASTWKGGDPIVRQGSAEFEAGLYAGISKNAAAQEAWVAAHEHWGKSDPGIAERLEMHAAFTETLRAEAATTTDLDTMTPGNNPQPGGNTPFNGPGTVPPMAGGMDPAAPGGAGPYNGAPPFSSPVAPDPGWQDPHRKMSDLDRQAAFRQTVAARLAASEPKNTPVCRGCGEAFENRKVAEQEHGKMGCGTESGERGYEMKRESEAW
jgi:hypothetical protein